MEFELYPLTFDEYEGMKKFYHKEIHPGSEIELNSYLLEGGFPRTVLFDRLEEKRIYVRGLIDEIFEKDIAVRTKIRDVGAFTTVRNYVINNFGATTSINRLQKSLEGNGLRISRATLSHYIQILRDAKILYLCPRFGRKVLGITHFLSVPQSERSLRPLPYDCRDHVDDLYSSA